jgi:hypothetical protein
MSGDMTIAIGILILLKAYYNENSINAKKPKEMPRLSCPWPSSPEYTTKLHCR